MYDLTDKKIEVLNDLVKRIENFKGKWIDEEESDFCYVCTDKLADEAMDFLYGARLIIDFAWPKWTEGREFYKNNDPQKYNNLDREFILKLLTAVARNERFCSGAWGRLFESGEAQKLYKRLLETYKK